MNDLISRSETVAAIRRLYTNHGKVQMGINLALDAVEEQPSVPAEVVRLGADAATAESSWGALSESFDEAIAALEEKQERSKGCEFCTLYDFRRASAVVDPGKYAAIYLAGAAHQFPKSEQFKYCPNCGARMDGEEEKDG